VINFLSPKNNLKVAELDHAGSSKIQSNINEMGISKHEAGQAYVDAAHFYKKPSINGIYGVGLLWTF
jgi:hypothetical protein